VALRVALQRPDLVRAMVLVGSSGLLERNVEGKVPHNPSRDWIEQKIFELFHDPSRMYPGTIDLAYRELTKRSASRAFVKLGKSARDDHMGHLLHDIRVPVQIVWGRQDTVTPPEAAEQFARLLPGARLEWIDRCGHAPHIECPGRFTEIVTGFVDRVLHLRGAREGGQGAA
jgi:pimeloyl-ACP methyl ester carboxylesterase